MSKQNSNFPEKQTWKKEDLTSVSFVTIIHNDEADIGKTEAWERSTVINNNNYHQNHYLLMELARGYLNPNSSDWKSLPILTKYMNSEDEKNEDPIDEEEEKEEDKRTEKTGNTVRKQIQKERKVIVTLP